MASITVNQKNYHISAASPAMVAVNALIMNGAQGDTTAPSVPAYHRLNGVLYIYGTAEPHDAGPLVELKMEEATKTLEIVANIHREIVLVRADHQALKSAKARLEQMQAEKLFAFTDQIDAPSFRILCAILTQGNVAKAARALNIKDATLRSRVKDWRRRGPAYQVLIELVRWRKGMAARGTVPLNEAITRATAAPADFAGLLSDVLDELLTMNEDNWSEVAEALAELLRPHVAR